ncbi:hypothetical protein XELAEV_18043044mg [Xenopus laevis]|uniref:Uncharacterized protein n=1 Tax=Xenopus laevis TaxID=8355 RepID=A0A974C503_XENLA|nr:hypothetical protein XELAEV_18043044mg [Xenopus laevis]
MMMFFLMEKNKIYDRNQTNRPVVASQYCVFSKKVENVVKVIKKWKTVWSPPMLSCKIGGTLKDELCPEEQKKRDRGHKYSWGNPKFGTSPCLNCVCCSGVIKGETINHPTKDIKCFATYDTKQVIYLLKCPCGLAYVFYSKGNGATNLYELY